jgi:hypothetical protein
MKSKLFGILILLLGVLSQISFAQAEWEKVYNPRTGTYERIYNPGNPTQVAIEQQQRERQAEDILRQTNDNIREINETYNRRREEANEQLKRNQEFWDDLGRDQQFRMIEMNSRTNYGTSIIKAGKATTTFQPDPSFDFFKILVKRAKNNQQLALIQQYANPSRKVFFDELKLRGFAQNDIADGVVLVFVMAYEVYANQKPGNAVIQKMRQEVKGSLLKRPIFQSYTSAERQQEYELYATLTGYTKILFDKGLKGDKAALIEAQSNAKGLLEKFWGNTANTIQLTATGFVHKGTKIIADGKATQFFKYNPNLDIVEMSVSKTGQFRSQIVSEFKQNLQLFYQTMSQKGGQKGDLAWCGTMVGFVNFYVLTKQNWTPVQTKSVYDFMKGKINAMPDIQAADDNSKQITCEQMALSSANNYANFVKGRPGSTSTATALLGDLFRLLGEDANNYQWTANGIVKVK